MSILKGKVNQIKKKRAHVQTDLEHINQKYAHNVYKTRSLKEMALYNVILHMNRDGELDTQLQRQLGQIFNKLNPNVNPRNLKDTSFISTHAEAKQEAKDRKRYSTNSRGGVAWTEEEAQAYAFGAMADKVLANDSLAHSQPLSTKNPKSPFTAKIKQLGRQGYNYRGARQLLLHRAVQRNRFNIRSKQLLENRQRYINKHQDDTNMTASGPQAQAQSINYHNNVLKSISEQKRRMEHNAKLNHACFKYFHVDPRTYQDTYPGRTVGHKYQKEAIADRQPRAYGTVMSVSLTYQRKQGLTPEESIQRMSANLEHAKHDSKSPYSDLGLSQRFGGALRRFSMHREKERQSQKKFTRYRSHQDEGPEF